MAEQKEVRDQMELRATVGFAGERPGLAATGARMLDWAGERVDFAGGLLNFYGHAFQHLVQ